MLSTTTGWQTLGNRRKTRLETESIAEEPALPNAAMQLRLLNPSSAWRTLGGRFRERASASQFQDQNVVLPFSRASSEGSPVRPLSREPSSEGSPPDSADAGAREGDFSRSSSVPRAGTCHSFRLSAPGPVLMTMSAQKKNKTVVELFWEQEMAKMTEALEDVAQKRAAAEAAVIRRTSTAGKSDSSPASFRSAYSRDPRSCSRSSSSREGSFQRSSREGSFRRMRRDSSGASSRRSSAARSGCRSVRRMSLGHSSDDRLFQGLIYTDAAHLLLRH